MNDFDGLVTGGASGIGAATAGLLQRRGARVAILDRQVAGTGQQVAMAVPADVTDRAAVRWT